MGRRTLTGDRDKVRKAFQSAMRRVRQDIQQFNPAFAEHLKTHLRCGWNPCYTPQDGVCWVT